MPDIVLTVAGNLTDDPELRFTPNGAAVASFNVASTPRFFDRTTNDWKDGDTTFIRCTVWRQQAENVAESMRRGQRVVVTGTLRQHNWESPEGEKRSRLEMQCDEVAASMRFATVTAEKAVPREDDAPDDEPEDAPPPPRTSRRSGNGRPAASQRRERATTRSR